MKYTCINTIDLVGLFVGKQIPSLYCSEGYKVKMLNIKKNNNNYLKKNKINEIGLVFGDISTIINVQIVI